MSALPDDPHLLPRRNAGYWQCLPPPSPPAPRSPPLRKPPPLRNPPNNPPSPPAGTCQRVIDDWGQCGGTTGSCVAVRNPSISYCDDWAWPDRCCRRGATCKRR